jgi:hypothetical protein
VAVWHPPPLLWRHPWRLHWRSMAYSTDLRQHGSPCSGKVTRPLLWPDLINQGSIFLLQYGPLPHGSEGFHLIIAFGRANFRLDALLVNSALKYCIGNSESDFHVTHIRDRVFRFIVISKAVGFLVYNLRSFSCLSFICHFHLLGFGGPNWVHEHSLWLAEQESSWQTMSHRNPPLTGANVIPVASRSFADVARSTHLDPISSDLVPSP